MATQLCAAVSEPVRHVPSPDSLAAIRDRDAALAIWKRATPVDLAAALDALCLDAVDDVECPIGPSGCDLADTLMAAGYGADIAMLLARDIATLAGTFAPIAGAARLKLRLEIVETDACRRFHSDFVTYRLLTTYRGQATQWARADTPEVIEEMAAGDVAIFKGRVLLDEPPILHRSPPIEARGEQRLLMVLDPWPEP